MWGRFGGFFFFHKRMTSNIIIIFETGAGFCKIMIGMCNAPANDITCRILRQVIRYSRYNDVLRV